MSEIVNKAATNEVVELLYNDLRERIGEVPSADNIVMVQDQQPALDANKVWLTETPPTGVEVPTYGEFTGVIAPDYANLSFPVSAGEHCIHNGVLYTAKQNINSSEVWTAAHWDAGSVSSKLTSLSNDIHELHTVPSGGSSGQVLGKASGTDYDIEWKTVSGGGVVDSSLNKNSTNPVENSVIAEKFEDYDDVLLMRTNQLLDYKNCTQHNATMSSSAGMSTSTHGKVAIVPVSVEPFFSLITKKLSLLTNICHSSFK